MIVNELSKLKIVLDYILDILYSHTILRLLLHNTHPFVSSFWFSIPACQYLPLVFFMISMLNGSG
jgi:hypothetical protein